MAERMTNGAIKLAGGKIVYGNSVVTVEDLPELLEVLNKPMEAAAKDCLREVRDRMEHPPVAPKIQQILLESRFRTYDGRVFNFSLETGKEYAELSIGYTKGGGLTIGMGAIRDPREVERARKLLGIDPGQPEGHWFEACIQAMKGVARMERHLGSNKLFARPNRKTSKSRLWIGKPKANWPKGRKG